MEVSSHALDQRRADGTRFACAVFTNLTQDHLDYHGTMESYYAAKRRLFLDLAPRAAVVNADDEAGARLLGELRGAVGDSAPRVLWSYGFSAGCDLRIRNLSLGPRGSAFDLDLPGGRGSAAAAVSRASFPARRPGLPARGEFRGRNRPNSPRFQGF